MDSSYPKGEKGMSPFQPYPPYPPNEPTQVVYPGISQPYPPYPPNEGTQVAYPGISQPYLPYPPNEASPVPPPGIPPPYTPNTTTQGPPSSIPQMYPPYPSTEVPPVTSPPSTHQGHQSGVLYQPSSGVTTIQVVEAQTNFGSESQYVRCPNCGAQNFTKIEHKATSTTHLMALLLCCFVLWPIAWLPYVCNSCQSTVHYCSHCNQFLGEKNI